MAEFDGIPKESFAFLSELQSNNSKDWFDQNRDRYDQYWKAPAFALIEALRPHLADLPLPLKAEARINGSLRRINRDVRFSKDKSPYSPQLHMAFWSGTHPGRSPGLHIVLHPATLGYGAGVYGVEPAALKTLRDRISDAGERADLIAALGQGQTVGCTLDAPDLVNLPKGYTDQTGDWTHLLRRKAFILRTQGDVPVPEWLSGPPAVDQIIGLARALNPFLAWLAR